MKLSNVVSAAVIALAALALTAQGQSAETSASKSNSPKITIAVDGKDCTTKGGTLITNKDGSKTCTMPTNCKLIASAAAETNRCSVAKVTAKSGPEQCCCRGCQNSTLPRCSFCSGP